MIVRTEAFTFASSPKIFDFEGPEVNLLLEGSVPKGRAVEALYLSALLIETLTCIPLLHVIDAKMVSRRERRRLRDVYCLLQFLFDLVQLGVCS